MTIQILKTIWGGRSYFRFDDSGLDLQIIIRIEND
jgi:hypothetical protein